MSRMHDQDNRDVSLMALDQYMRFVNCTSQMTPEEEGQLLERIERGKAERAKQFPDGRVVEDARQARDRVIEGLQWLVRRQAYRYVQHCRSMDVLDLIQEGNLGLMEAIERYHPHQQIAFRGSASRYVSEAIWRGMSERDRTVRLPLRVHQELGQMRKAEKRLRGRLGRDPLVQETADEMGVSVEKFTQLLESERGQYVESIQAMVNEDRPEDHLDFVAMYQASAREQSARQEELEQVIGQALETVLAKRQREVVELRYGFGEDGRSERSCLVVAEMLGVSRGCVVATDRVAKRRLRPMLGKYADDQQQDGEVA